MTFIKRIRQNRSHYQKTFVIIGLLITIIALGSLMDTFLEAFNLLFSRVAFTDLRMYQSEYFGSTVLFPFFVKLLGGLSFFFYGLFMVIYHPYTIEWSEQYIVEDQAIRLVAILLTPFIFWYAIRHAESYQLT